MKALKSSLKKKLVVVIALLLLGVFITTGCDLFLNPGAENRTPVAMILASTSNAGIGVKVTFSAASSTDPDGDALYCIWQITSPSGSQAAITSPINIFQPAEFTPDVTGSYTITLTVSDSKASHQAQATVIVSADVDYISIFPRDITIEDGDTLQLAINPEGVFDEITWTSSSPWFAAVGETTGLITAWSPGTTRITATLGDLTDEIVVQVVEEGQAVALTGITVEPATKEMVTGGSFYLDVNLVPEGTTDAGIQFSSSDETVAFVTSSGQVTAKAVGSAVITVSSLSDSTIAGTCTITVGEASEEAVTGISVSPSSESISIGEFFLLDVSFVPAGTSAEITYSTSNANTATVSDYGLVEGLGAGTATITVTAVQPDGSNGAPITGTCSVDVIDTSSVAQSYFEWGLDALEEGDVDGAYNWFSLAVLSDPSHMGAIIGYTMLDLAYIAVDSDVRTFAQSQLGLSGYPATMQQVIDPEEWMDELAWLDDDGMPIWGDGGPGTIHVDDYGEIYSEFFPSVQGATDDDGNGQIDMQERMFAMIENIVVNGNFLNDIVNLAITEMDERIDDAMTVITGLASDAYFELTFEMVSGGEPYDTNGDDHWPNEIDENNNPVPIRIGRSELLMIGAGLEQLRSFAYLAKTINLNLPLDEFWGAVDLENGGIDFTAVSGIFAGVFLRPRDDVDASLQTAKDSMLAAIGYYDDALSSFILRNGTDFYLDATNPTFAETNTGDGPPKWSDLLSGFNFSLTFLDELAYSIENSTVMYVPINGWDFDGPVEFFQAYTSNWPTASDFMYTPSSTEAEFTGTSVAVNPGLFYSDVQGIAALVEMDTFGEPAFYISDGAGGFDPLPVDSTYDMNTDYYLRSPDVTFGGAIPIDNLPFDDVAALNTWYDDITGVGTFVFIEDTTTGALEMYVTDIPQAAGHSFTAVDEIFLIPDNDEDGIPEQITSYGSYWFGFGEFMVMTIQELLKPEFVDWNLGGADSASYNYDIDDGDRRYFRLTGLDSTVSYKVRIFGSDGNLNFDVYTDEALDGNDHIHGYWIDNFSHTFISGTGYDALYFEFENEDNFSFNFDVVVSEQFSDLPIDMETHYTVYRSDEIYLHVTGLDTSEAYTVDVVNVVNTFNLDIYSDQDMNEHLDGRWVDQSSYRYNIGSGFGELFIRLENNDDPVADLDLIIHPTFDGMTLGETFDMNLEPWEERYLHIYGLDEFTDYDLFITSIDDQIDFTAYSDENFYSYQNNENGIEAEVMELYNGYTGYFVRIVNESESNFNIDIEVQEHMFERIQANDWRGSQVVSAGGDAYYMVPVNSWISHYFRIHNLTGDADLHVYRDMAMMDLVGSSASLGTDPEGLEANVGETLLFIHVENMTGSEVTFDLQSSEHPGYEEIALDDVVGGTVASWDSDFYHIGDLNPAMSYSVDIDVLNGSGNLSVYLDPYRFQGSGWQDLYGGQDSITGLTGNSDLYIEVHNNNDEPDLGYNITVSAEVPM
jgi:uncharacterized protein YjdB